MAGRAALLTLHALGIEMYHQHGVEINRPKGSGDFVFIHFLTPAEIVLGNRTVREEAGSCIVYAPPKPQRYRGLPGRPFGNNWFHFGGRTPEAYLKSLALPLNRPFRPASMSFVTPALRRINSEKTRRDPHWPIAIDLHLRQFFLELARNCVAGTAAKTSPRLAETKEQLRRLRSKLLETCSDTWTVEDMAARVHLSRSRFSVVYRRVFGLSPLADLLRMRMELAKYYLGMMHMTLEEVAESCGFASVHYFHRQFKRITGITPGAFQRSHSGDDLLPPAPRR